MYVVLLGWRESVEKDSIHLEVRLFKPGDADSVASFHREHEDGKHSSVAAVAWNKEPATY